MRATRNILNLVENDAVGIVNSEESDDGAEDGYAEHDLVVGDGEEEHIIVLNTLGGVVIVFLLVDGLGPWINHHRLRGCASWASHAGGRGSFQVLRERDATKSLGGIKLSNWRG